MEASNLFTDTFELSYGFPAHSTICEVCDNGNVIVALPNTFMTTLRDVGATKLEINGVKFSIQSYQVKNLKKLKDNPQVVMLSHEPLMNNEQVSRWFRAILTLASQGTNLRRRLLKVARKKLAQLPELYRTMSWDTPGTSNARRRVSTAPKRLRRSEPVSVPIRSDRRISSENENSPNVPAQMPQPIPTNNSHSEDSSAMAYCQQGYTIQGQCIPSSPPTEVPQPLPLAPQYSQQQPVNNQYYQQPPSFGNNYVDLNYNQGYQQPQYFGINYVNFNQRAPPNPTPNIISNNYFLQELVNQCFNHPYYQNIFKQMLYESFLQYYSQNQYQQYENNGFVNRLDNQMVRSNYQQPTTPNYVQPNYPPPSYPPPPYQALASQPSNTEQKQLQQSSTFVNSECNNLGDSFNNQAGSIQTYTDEGYGKQSVNTGLDSSFYVRPMKLENDQDQIEDDQGQIEDN